MTALDESAARLVAVREGIKLVMAGSIIEDNGRYTLYVRALDPKGGEVLTSAEVDAKDKLDVLAERFPIFARLPLPLGANAIHKRHGERLPEIARILEASIRYGLDHRDEALDYALRYGRGLTLSGDVAARLWIRGPKGRRTLSGVVTGEGIGYGVGGYLFSTG